MWAYDHPAVASTPHSRECQGGALIVRSLVDLPAALEQLVGVMGETGTCHRHTDAHVCCYCSAFAAAAACWSSVAAACSLPSAHFCICDLVPLHTPSRLLTQPAACCALPAALLLSVHLQACRA